MKLGQWVRRTQRGKIHAARTESASGVTELASYRGTTQCGVVMAGFRREFSSGTGVLSDIVTCGNCRRSRKVRE